MRGFISFWVEVWEDRRGISATELGLLAGLIGGGVAMGGDSLGDALGDTFGGAADTVADAGDTTGGAGDGTDGGSAADGDGTTGSDGDSGISSTRATPRVFDAFTDGRIAAIRDPRELDRIRRAEDGLIPALQNRIVFFDPSVGAFVGEQVDPR